MEETYTNNLECSNEMDNALQAVADKASCVTSLTCTATVTRNDCGTRRKRETWTTVVMSFSINLEGTGDNLNLTALIESNISKCILCVSTELWIKIPITFSLKHDFTCDDFICYAIMMGILESEVRHGADM